MNPTYEPITSTTALPDSKQWNKEVAWTLTPELIGEMKEDRGDARRPEVVTSDEDHDGNGHLWENIGVAITPNIASPYSMFALEAQLAAANIQVDRYVQTIEQMRRELDALARRKLEHEAIAVSRESAMRLLRSVAERHSVFEKDVAAQIDGTNDWLSLAWLIKADLVEHMGERFFVTDRGRQIVEAVFDSV